MKPSTEPMLFRDTKSMIHGPAAYVTAVILGRGLIWLLGALLSGGTLWRLIAHY